MERSEEQRYRSTGDYQTGSIEGGGNVLLTFPAEDSRSIRGRNFRPEIWLGAASYCSRCANLKRCGGTTDQGPGRCNCGGEFNSAEVVCPGCSTKITDCEKQLAAQFCVGQPAVDEDSPTEQPKSRSKPGIRHELRRSSLAAAAQRQSVRLKMFRRIWV